ncbi:hypothetical protein A33K_18820 [Burkholderia humptydooensis MSMB43]|uniref:Uncharacterized protein n=1 Tax=Burkholderia humptydooensis MSMB43 TaxID=441157 RepID=A0ABN0FWY3_9BURK|nr:hypothetical protein A33K_18820 [Burkholderia humptydooensis MSMB43]
MAHLSVRDGGDRYRSDAAKITCLESGVRAPLRDHVILVRKCDIRRPFDAQTSCVCRASAFAKDRIRLSRDIDFTVFPRAA